MNDITSRASLPEEDGPIVRIWDMPTRLFHWALAVLALISFTTIYAGGPDIPLPEGLPGGAHKLDHMTIHMWSGYGILVLLLFRIGWGLVGSSTARFSAFVHGPEAIVTYLRGFRRLPPAFYTGHNPLGALMVIALLADTLFQTLTGLFAKDDDDFLTAVAGPLSDSVSTHVSKLMTHLHHLNQQVLMILIYAHILVNLLYWLVLRENLIGAMFTGKRDLKPGQTAATVAFAANRRAVVLLVLAVVLVWAGLTLFRR